MYWCKPKPLFAICISVLLLAACKPEVKDGGQQYFDLKKYFEGEVSTLNKLHPIISKTVNYNGQPEVKQVMIKNWKQELGLFTESDINKPSWKSSYKIDTKGDSVIYTALEDNLRTRRMVIVQKNNTVKSIDITNFTQNLLYKTTDHLVYYPDSVYVIEKHQSVRILGDNNYQITGKFR